ncbi:hypothetical protein GALMADRAFT_1141536 [Galerina marginata CBS 339.88]|uniref:Uncharacterized protein n=1 Tax=Galerina marginata (strain CBS 339.88) TaxID=685588 RepID=A0A067SGG0_GALM3|nr:hypothetical protein GALMADRAFT_1141536 [Galerina marginata CBS 339.88]
MKGSLEEVGGGKRGWRWICEFGLECLLMRMDVRRGELGSGSAGTAGPRWCLDLEERVFTSSKPISCLPFGWTIPLTIVGLGPRHIKLCVVALSAPNFRLSRPVFIVNFSISLSTSLPVLRLTRPAVPGDRSRRLLLVDDCCSYPPPTTSLSSRVGLGSRRRILQPRSGSISVAGHLHRSTHSRPYDPSR